jgi:hypothetical protein
MGKRVCFLKNRLSVSPSHLNHRKYSIREYDANPFLHPGTLQRTSFPCNIIDAFNMSHVFGTAMFALKCRGHKQRSLLIC